MSLYEISRDHIADSDIFLTDGCTPHFHLQLEVLCVAAGSIELIINGVGITLDAGKVVFVNSFDVHGYRLTDKNSKGYVLTATNKHIQNLSAFLKDGIPESRILDGRAYTEIKMLFELYLSRQKAGNRVLMDGIIDSILGVIAECPAAKAVAPVKEHDVIRECLTYINNNYTEEISLDMLAKKYGYSPNHFSMLFNVYLKTGLNEYVNFIRADNAAIMLKENVNIIKAAMDSGFNSTRTFYRVFKSRYGMTPREYIKNT